MTIGERIKSRRIELGYSQEEVAKKCGYKSRSSINKIELSRSLPITKVESMAKALECSASYLMGWEDEDVIKSLNGDLDGDLILMDEKIKRYALKLYQLPETNQKLVMDLIDQLSKKEV